MKVFIKSVAKFFGEADVLLLTVSLMSTFYGLILISSVVGTFDVGNHIAIQIGAIIIGLALFILFSYVDIDIIADKSIFLLIFSALFISTLFFWGIGAEEVGNRAWLSFFGLFNIQPAEVVKIPFIIVIAKMVTTFRERRTLNNFLSLIQIVLVFVVLFGLILVSSADLGSALVYAFILIVMLFIGGVKLRWFLIGGAAIEAIFPVFWENYMSEAQRARVLVPFPVFAETLDPALYDRFSWHANQSVSAISAGGILGQGLGNGNITQRGIIFAQHTDFIFSAAGEELGFIGCLLMIVLLVFIITRTIYVGVKSNNSLGMMVCSGIAAMLIGHTIINIGMNLGVMPVIGITLPFFSYGGSAIVTCFAAMGIVSGIKMRPKPLRFRTM